MSGQSQKDLFHDIGKVLPQEQDLVSFELTEGVTGSIPVAPTIYPPCFKGLRQLIRTVSVGNPHLAHSWHSEVSIWPLSGSVEGNITPR